MVFFIHNYGFLVGLRTVIAAALICLAAMAVSCRTIQTVEVPVPVHDTTYITHNVHDSVWVENTTKEYVKGDTVYCYKTRVQYVERLRVDTLLTYKEKPVEVKVITTKYVEKQLAWWQKTLKYAGVFFLIGAVFFFVLLIIKSKT